MLSKIYGNGRECSSQYPVMCTTTLQILKFVHSPKTQNYKYIEKKTFFLQIKSFIHYFLGAITLAKKILAKKIQKKKLQFCLLFKLHDI